MNLQSWIFFLEFEKYLNAKYTLTEATHIHWLEGPGPGHMPCWLWPRSKLPMCIGAPARRLVDFYFDGGGLPRGYAHAQWNQDNEANIMVVAPLAIRHRTLLGNEAERRSKQLDGAAMLGSEWEEAEGFLSTSSSPWLRWAWRKGRRKSEDHAAVDGGSGRLRGRRYRVGRFRAPHFDSFGDGGFGDEAKLVEYSVELGEVWNSGARSSPRLGFW
jgi:hypothetical protein